MILNALTIHHLRNIVSAKFQLHPQCNVFYGPNGSGKTSLLEAIYMLGSGRSFRTREISPLITHGEDSLTLFAETALEDTISIQKSLAESIQVRINYQSCHTTSKLARLMPIQLFYQDIFQIMDAGPMVRRTLLDWGLFHVEPSYLQIWKNYRTVLKQRNALLKQKARREQFAPWDQQLVTLATTLDEMRSKYFDQWIKVFDEVLTEISDISCQLHYYKGWDKKESGKSLNEILQEQFTTDIQYQFTHSGPHQADIVVDTSSKKAKTLFSRGEQKITLIALKIAQAQLLTKDCVYLFDDLAAELDEKHIKRIVVYLSKISGQFFFTTIDKSLVKILQEYLKVNLFHIQKGSILPTSTEV